MRIEVQDARGYRYSIDSLNPDLLARWLLEVFDRARPDHVAPAYVQVFPSWDKGKADFVVDNRVLGRLYEVRSPKDVLTRMAEMIDEADKLP